MCEEFSQSWCNIRVSLHNLITHPNAPLHKGMCTNGIPIFAHPLSCVVHQVACAEERKGHTGIGANGLTFAVT